MAKQKPDVWSNRIIGSGDEAPDQLLANPLNWRIHPKHQKAALAGILADVGFVQEVIVNQRTGHLVDGHLRVNLAMEQGQPSIPVKYVDLSEEEEGLVLAMLDPIGAMAVADREKLDEILALVDSDNADVKAMLARLADEENLYTNVAADADDLPDIGGLDAWTAERQRVIVVFHQPDEEEDFYRHFGLTPNDGRVLWDYAALLSAAEALSSDAK